MRLSPRQRLRASVRGVWAAQTRCSHRRESLLRSRLKGCNVLRRPPLLQTFGERANLNLRKTSRVRATRLNRRPAHCNREVLGAASPARWRWGWRSWRPRWELPDRCLLFVSWRHWRQRIFHCVIPRHGFCRRETGLDHRVERFRHRGDWHGSGGASIPVCWRTDTPVAWRLLRIVTS